MKMNTKELLKKVELLKMIHNENDFSETAKYLYFRSNKIYSFNGRLFIAVEFENDFTDFSIPTLEFFSILQKMKKNEFEMKQENEKIVILYGNNKIELLTNEKEINFGCDNNFVNLPKNFIEGIKLTKFCVNKNATDGSGYLTILNNNVYSTDKYRISKYILNENVGDFLLPYDCIEPLVKINPKYYNVETENFYLFKNEDNVIIGILKNKIESMDFNKYTNIFENNDTIKINLPDEIKENIQLSEIFTSNDLLQKEVEFKIQDKKIICKSLNDRGMIETVLDIDFDSEMSFFIHPIFLLEIISVCNKLELLDDIAIFRNDNFCYFFRVKK